MVNLSSSPPCSSVSPGYSLQPLPLSLLGFPPLLLQLLVPPLGDLQKVPPSVLDAGFLLGPFRLVGGRGRLRNPDLGDAEAGPDAPPPHHHVHGQQAGPPQLQGLAVGRRAQAGAPLSRSRPLRLKAGPAVLGVLGHQGDLRVLEELQVAVRPVGVGGAELSGALLPDDLGHRVPPFAHACRTVRTHLRQNQQFLISLNGFIISRSTLAALQQE